MRFLSVFLLCRKTMQSYKLFSMWQKIFLLCRFLLYLCSRKLLLVRCEMSKYEIPFLTAAVQAFGQRYAMTRQAAFNYLREHKGLAFLIEFYDVEHLQSMDETIDDVLIVCQKNGGAIA